MIANLLFHIQLFLCSLSLLQSVWVETASPYPTYSLAKSSECPDKCGNTTIPFPFGIGANCFLDEWYEILCNNDVPRLKKLDLKVHDILPYFYFDDPNIIIVDYPIFYSNSSCGSTKQTAMAQPATFYKSPFVVSPKDNIFMAVGCENTAKLNVWNHKFVGCKTQCTGNNTRRHSFCHGVDCCQSTTPDVFQRFSVDFQGERIIGTSGRDHDCQFAFLASSSWIDPNRTDLYRVRDGDYVPMMLRWGITDAAFPASIGLKLSHHSYEDAAYCQEVPGMNISTTTFIICSCSSFRFDGNPYVKGGCKEKGSAEELMAVANLAKRCLKLKGRKRPTMKELVMELEGIRNLGGHSTSRVDENQGIASNQEFIGTSRAKEALALSRGPEMDTCTICVSDVQPLMPSQTG